jgi:DNA-binding FrmR family transcriptional regulator
VSNIEADAYRPDVMQQLAAVQGLLEGASRIMLRRHLETCVAKAMQENRTEEIVDELMETLKFDKHVFRPASVSEHDLAAGTEGSDDV